MVDGSAPAGPTDGLTRAWATPGYRTMCKFWLVGVVVVSVMSKIQLRRFSPPNSFLSIVASFPIAALLAAAVTLWPAFRAMRRARPDPHPLAEIDPAADITEEWVGSGFGLTSVLALGLDSFHDPRHAFALSMLAFCMSVGCLWAFRWLSDWERLNAVRLVVAKPTKPAYGVRLAYASARVQNPLARMVMLPLMVVHTFFARLYAPLRWRRYFYRRAPAATPR